MIQEIIAGIGIGIGVAIVMTLWILCDMLKSNIQWAYWDYKRKQKDKRGVNEKVL